MIAAVSLAFTPSYAYSTPLLSSVVPSDISSRSFNASIIMRVPYQDITYIPAVSEVLKVAWIQYVAFFVVVAFVLFRLNSFIFRHQVFALFM